MMPGKRNPSIPELVSQIAFRIQGNHSTVMLAFQNGQLDLNVMTPVLATVALESTHLLAHGVRLLRSEVFETFEPIPSRMREFHRINTQKATALIPKYGHKRVGEWIAQALEAGVPVDDILPPAILEEAEREIERTMR
jgi:aspartate ammonia-lyase